MQFVLVCNSCMKDSDVDKTPPFRRIDPVKGQPLIVIFKTYSPWIIEKGDVIKRELTALGEFFYI